MARPQTKNAVSPKRIYLGISALFLAAGIFFFRPKTSVSSIQVGELTLNQKEVELYERAARIKSPSISRASALNQLVASFTRLQILKNVGVNFDSKTIEREEKRIAPLIENGGGLAKIREVFGKDGEAFRKLYVIPTLADKTLYQDYFQHKAPVQMEARKRAERFLEAFKREPEAVRRLADGEKLPVFRLTVSRATGLHWEELGAEPERKVASKRNAPLKGAKSLDAEIWFRRVISGMEVGEVRDTLQEYEDSWLALRRLGKDPSDASAERLEVVKFPQANYETWYHQQVSKVAVRKF